jgi:predicted nuclease of restriction endonuclease-like RecB superfamily
MVTRDRRLTLRMMSDELNISKEAIRQVAYEDLRERKIYANFVPQSLTMSRSNRDSRHAKTLSRLVKTVPVFWGRVIGISI